MMYSNKFVASLKVGGKILRENSGVVSLPFGSEYGILLKNLNSRRAMATVTVDGQDATEGTRLILPANGSIDLERFIRNGNLNEGNRFKFIERTEKIEEHRGIKADDGLIRVEFWAEKEVVDVPVIRNHYYDNYWYNRPYYIPYREYPTHWCQPSITCTNGVYGGAIGAASQMSQSGALNSSTMDFGSAQNYAGPLRAMSCNVASTFDNRGEVQAGEANDAGITVPGSLSSQKFQSSYGFDLESNSQVIILQLRGKVGGKPVPVAVSVDTKPICPTCGKTNKPQDKFCRECGTGLQLV